MAQKPASPMMWMSSGPSARAAGPPGTADMSAPVQAALAQPMEHPLIGELR